MLPCWSSNVRYRRISIRISILCGFTNYYTIFRPFKIKFTSKLINDILKVLQKLLRCFNGTENSTSFVFPSSDVFPVILLLYLKDSEFIVRSELLGSSL